MKTYDGELELKAKVQEKIEARKSDTIINKKHHSTNNS